jgi:hypothetical protein
MAKRPKRICLNFDQRGKLTPASWETFKEKVNEDRLIVFSSAAYPLGDEGAYCGFPPGGNVMCPCGDIWIGRPEPRQRPRRRS